MFCLVFCVYIVFFSRVWHSSSPHKMMIITVCLNCYFLRSIIISYCTGIATTCCITPRRDSYCTTIFKCFPILTTHRYCAGALNTFKYTIVFCRVFIFETLAALSCFSCIRSAAKMCGHQLRRGKRETLRRIVFSARRNPNQKNN